MLVNYMLTVDSNFTKLCRAAYIWICGDKWVELLPSNRNGV